MKTASYFGISALAVALVPVAIACSDDGRIVGDIDLDASTDHDASTSTPPLPPDDGGAPIEDAGANDGDATTDAGDPVPPRTCSDDGWCHTVVPDEQNLRDVWGDGQGTVWTVSAQGNILRWDGAAWTQHHAAGGALYAVWGSSPTDIWVGGAMGLLHGTGATSSSITWSVVESPVPVYSIWGTSANDVWAAGYTAVPASSYTGGRLLHYSGPPVDADAGTGWEVDPVSTPFPGRYMKVWGTSATDVWLGGDSTSSRGRVLHRVPDGEGGFTWSAGNQPTSGNFKGAGSISRTNVFLLGFGPPETYFTGLSDDDGATFTWTHHDGFKTGFAHNAVWGTGPNDIWLAGHFGRLRHWDGTSWRIARIALDNLLPVIKTFNAIWGSGTNDVWVVGEGIALHKRPPEKL